MNIIKAILVDDEANNINLLQSLLMENCKNINVIATAENAEKGYALIRELKPQLVFMDIDMPGMTGFELLQKLEPLTFESNFCNSLQSICYGGF